MGTTDLITYMEGIATQRTLFREGQALCDQLENLLARVEGGTNSIQSSLQAADGIYDDTDLANAKLLIDEFNTRLKTVSGAIDLLVGG